MQYNYINGCGGSVYCTIIIHSQNRCRCYVHSIKYTTIARAHVLFCIIIQLRKALLGSKRLVDLETVYHVCCAQGLPLAISDVVMKLYPFICHNVTIFLSCMTYIWLPSIDGNTNVY